MNALASQCRSEDHKDHWLDEVRQSSPVIRWIRHLSLLGKLAWSVCVLLLISS